MPNVFTTTDDIEFDLISYYISDVPAENDCLILFRDGHQMSCVYHSVVGPALISGATKYYFRSGIKYSMDEWFSLLTPEEQMIALYNPDNF